MHFHFKTGFLFFIAMYLLTAASIASGADEDIAARVDEYIGPYVTMHQFSGTVLIAQNGQVMVSKGYGMANYQYDIPNGPQTKFRIGSLTKSFTAMAVMMLQERGLLDVSDPISTYIPDYPNGGIITIHHLLTHTSGIPDHAELPDYNRERRVYRYDIDDTIETFKNLPLEFTPGEKFQYSNSGYILLGYIIEKVSQTSYENFIGRNILQPLGMEHTGYEHTGEIIHGLAAGYTMQGSDIVNAAYRDISNAHASGALYSTAEDLYLWDRALYTESLVGRESLEKMFTPYTETYGYGWGVVDVFDRLMLGHNGETDGYQTNITRFPNDDVCIIVLSNFEQAPVGRIGIDLAAMVFGEPYDIPKVRQEIAVDPAVLKAYTGEYELNADFHLVISVENDRLFCQPTGQPLLELHPETETSFFLGEVDAQISFVSNENDIIDTLILHQGGNDITFTKLP